MGGFQAMGQPAVREGLWDRSFVELCRPDPVDAHLLSHSKADPLVSVTELKF